MEVNSFKPALYLIPVGLSDAEPCSVVPALTIEALRHIRYMVVENLRTARRWIKRCDRNIDIDAIRFSELNEHTDMTQIGHLLDPLRKGEPVGVMSEAGCPGIADPGAALVELAHRESLPVVPLVGPSSILLSLMASGFNGQNFAFHGYLPIADADRTRTVQNLERESSRLNRTQIFIETPYRNNKMIKFLAETLRPETKLCVAANITDPEKEKIMVFPASKWKTLTFDFAKQPAIFLISASVAMSTPVHSKTKRR